MTQWPYPATRTTKHSKQNNIYKPSIIWSSQICLKSTYECTIIHKPKRLKIKVRKLNLKVEYNSKISINDEIEISQLTDWDTTCRSPGWGRRRWVGWRSGSRRNTGRTCDRCSESSSKGWCSLALPRTARSCQHNSQQLSRKIFNHKFLNTKLQGDVLNEKKNITFNT